VAYEGRDWNVLDADVYNHRASKDAPAETCNPTIFKCGGVEASSASAVSRSSSKPRVLQCNAQRLSEGGRQIKGGAQIDSNQDCWPIRVVRLKGVRLRGLENKTGRLEGGSVDG
jgi:hypothetical protein